MNIPLVSVIVPNFNYAEYLGSALRAIESQTYPSFEVIVIDDGSTDTSVDLVTKQFPKFKLIPQKNKGVNAARNAGINVARGELIALCDADDLWLPTKLEKQVPRFLKTNIVLVGSHIKQFESDSYKSHLIYATTKGNLKKMYMRKPGTAWIPGACSSAVFLKSSALDAGLFDEHLVGSAEDWEFFARLAAEGEFDYVEEVLVEIRKHKTSRSSVTPSVWYRDNKKALESSFSKDIGWTLGEKIRAHLHLLFVTLKSIVKSGRV